MKISQGLAQAYDMQNFAYKVSMAIRDNLKRDDGVLIAPDKDTAASIATLGRLWRDAQEQVRIHRGKPLPGSLTPAERKPARSAKHRVLSALVSDLEAERPVVVPMPGAAGEPPAQD